MYKAAFHLLFGLCLISGQWLSASTWSQPGEDDTQPLEMIPTVILDSPPVLSSGPYSSYWLAENTSAATPETPQPGYDFFSSKDTFEDLPRTLSETGDPLEDDTWELEDREGSEEPSPASSWIERKGYLEYRGTYSTNIDLSAPDIDFDLRRKHTLNRDAIRETEVSDWINEVILDYDYEFPIVPEAMKGAVRYHLEQDEFGDEGREDLTSQNFELASIQKLTESIEWELYGGFEYENRDSQAQYLTPDYQDWYFGTEVRQTLENGRYLALGYEYTHRDYESLYGGFPPEETPWADWEQHALWIRSDQDLCENLTLNLRLNFEARDHDSPALTNTGQRISGTYRQYDLWEPRAGFTYAPTERDTFRFYYRYRALNSTGDYYDYRQDSLTLQYVRAVCPGLIFRSEFEYLNRDYTDQVAYLDLVNPGLHLNRHQVREDERISLYFAVEKTMCADWTTGVEYTYTDNDSNDDSSRYQEDRYGVYVRRDF